MQETDRRVTETPRQRLDRNFNELLQELRVAQAGVQILFGFLLSIAFTELYTRADPYVRTTHMVTVMFTALSVAFLTAPAAWHRMLFRRGRRREILGVANHFALSGLACLAIAMTGTVLLLAEVVIGGWPAIVFGALAALVFGSLWFLAPMRERADAPDPDTHPDFVAGESGSDDGVGAGSGRAGREDRDQAAADAAPAPDRV
ncbi:MAG TPA: DUF6328 family protein [Pseudonocardiaceae bacterium]